MTKPPARRMHWLCCTCASQQGRGRVYLSSWPGNPPTVSSVALVCLHCGDKNVLALLRWLALLCNDTLIMLLSCAVLCCVLRVSLPARSTLTHQRVGSTQRNTTHREVLANYGANLAADGRYVTLTSPIRINTMRSHDDALMHTILSHAFTVQWLRRTCFACSVL